MIGLLTSIVDFIVSVISLLIHTLESFFNLIIRIPTYVSFLSVSISHLPTIIIPYALASISVYVVFLVLRRGPSE